MKNVNELSPLALAFMGDAIHTAYVRKFVLNGEKQLLNAYNNQAKQFCNAQAQAEVLDVLQPILTDEEKEIVRKTRNTHNKHSAKNFDEETYKKATSFEALLGWLYLTENTERLEEILKIAVKR